LISICLQSSVSGVKLKCDYRGSKHGSHRCKIEKVDLSKKSNRASFTFLPTEDEKTRTTGIEFWFSGKVAHLPQNLKQVFPNLIEFWLEHSEIPILRSNLFGPQFKWIELLDLQNDSVQMIEENAFAQLTNLAEIRLSQNKLKSLSTKTFQYNLMLKWIYLDHNKIKIIDPQTFYNLNQLRIIDLKQNECVDQTFGSEDCKIDRSRLDRPLLVCYENYGESLKLLNEGSVYYICLFTTLTLFFKF
jgi:hypothetical protein